MIVKLSELSDDFNPPKLPLLHLPNHSPSLRHVLSIARPDVLVTAFFEGEQLDLIFLRELKSGPVGYIFKMR